MNNRIQQRFDKSIAEAVDDRRGLEAACANETTRLRK